MYILSKLAKGVMLSQLPLHLYMESHTESRSLYLRSGLFRSFPGRENNIMRTEMDIWLDKDMLGSPLFKYTDGRR